jgi:hypothetical protein
MLSVTWKPYLVSVVMLGVVAPFKEMKKSDYNPWVTFTTSVLSYLKNRPNKLEHFIILN